MDDDVLLRRARHGDRDAFESIVSRYQDELYTMAVRITGNRSDAADVVQETFLRAYTHMRDLRDSTLRPWLFRVAVNCSRDVLRRSSRRPADPLEDEAGKILELPDPSVGPEATALARERVALLAQALASIPADFRVAVVLRDVNDLSYEEAAHALRVPVGTVKSRVSRGRGLLAAALRGSSVLGQAAGGSV